MAGAAAVTGSALLVSRQQQTETTTACADTSVVGLLQGIYSKVANIEAVLGKFDEKVPRSKKPGIDIVLGAQWGDEGKGKLVDILSQVCGTYSLLTVNCQSSTVNCPCDGFVKLLLKLFCLARNMTFAPELQAVPMQDIRL